MCRLLDSTYGESRLVSGSEISSYDLLGSLGMRREGAHNDELGLHREGLGRSNRCRFHIGAERAERANAAD